MKRTYTKTSRTTAWRKKEKLKQVRISDGSSSDEIDEFLDHQPGTLEKADFGNGDAIQECSITYDSCTAVDDSPQCTDDDENEHNAIEEDEHAASSTEHEGTDSELDDREFAQNNYASDRIYNGASLTIMESCVMLMSFFLHFKLSYACMNAFLVLITAHLPSNNKVIKSMYLLRKFFSSNNQMYKKVQCCSLCGRILNNETRCQNCPKSVVCSFLIFDIESQIHTLFKREDFIADLTLRFHKTKNPSTLEHVTDGTLYQSFKNYIKSVYDFTLMLYTDGMQLYNSSNITVWPIFFTFNELPFNRRYLPQNVIFGGLWYASSKPHFDAFMLPLVESFKKLKNGIKVMLSTGNFVNVRGYLLSCTADMPAKAQLLNMKNHNGFYSCIKCFIKGETIRMEGNKRKFVYKFSENLVLRCHKQFICHSEEAQNTKKAVFGLKGVNIFSKLVVDCIRGVGSDDMHGVFGGTGGKRPLELWFDGKYKSCEFSLYKKLSLVDDRLLKLKPPNFIKRLPRSIKHHLAFFKTSELKNWFFYYSIPVLCDLMERSYLTHYFLLVHAMYLLNQNKVSLSDISLAETLLKEYVKDFELLYEGNLLTANLHSLLHKAEVVRCLGPSYETTCFPLEGLLGTMKLLVTGKTYAEKKIADSFMTLQSLPTYVTHLEENSVSRKFIKSLSQKKTKREEVEGGIFALGALKPILEISHYLMSAITVLDIINSTVPKVWIFHRLQKDEFTVVAKSYNSSIRHNSFLVSCKTGIFIIETFVKFKTCDCNYVCHCVSEYVAVAKKCETKTIEGLPENRFIFEILENHPSCSIPVTHILDVCVLSIVDGRSFYCKRVNSVEFE